MKDERKSDTVRCRVMRAVAHDGTATCRIHVPVGHPAAKFHELDGTAFEMEHELEFIAGPGITNLRAVDPMTKEEKAVGGTCSRYPRRTRRCTSEQATWPA